MATRQREVVVDAFHIEPTNILHSCSVKRGMSERG
jgi:hypothetical protein